MRFTKNQQARQDLVADLDRAASAIRTLRASLLQHSVSDHVLVLERLQDARELAKESLGRMERLLVKES